MRSHLWLTAICIIAFTASFTNGFKLEDNKEKEIIEKKFNKNVQSTLPTIPTTTKVLATEINETVLENDISHSEVGKKDILDDDYYSDDEYEDYDNDNSTNSKETVVLEHHRENKLIPTVIEKKHSPSLPNPPSSTKPNSDKLTSTVSPTDEPDEYDNEEYEDDGTNNEEDDDEDNYDESIIDDNLEDDESDDVLMTDTNDNKKHAIKCPRDCICDLNESQFLVATCSRLDAGIQKFDSSITDLQIVDIDPKYPIYLGEEIFSKIGLRAVKTIKISNATIKYLAPSAFAGLDKLFSLNLSRTGIEVIHPDAFVTNLRLKLLTLSGNDLSNMQHKISPYSKYMLKAPSVEELDLSNCNLKDLLPTAFNELKNIVYINLAENQIKTLPDGIFDKIPTIEEINLSFNLIEKLPKHIFNRTTLAILNLNYNEISTSLDFVTSDLQRLDLSYCKIKTINSQMFKGMDGLNHLSLKGNGLKKLHQLAFMPLSSLRYIDLSFNDLDQIGALTFAENRHIDIIKLNDNRRLRKLPAEGFVNNYGTFNTYSIDVSNCDIGHIADNTFSTMPLITTLNLSGNNIESISKVVFSYMPRLIELNLSNNILKKLNDKIFYHNRNLNKLNLSGNPISSVSLKLFTTTNNLSELDLSDCDLLQLWEDSSSQYHHSTKVLKKLRYLNVSLNDIESIYKSDLEGLDKLTVFDITNNPLKCDSNFKLVVKWLGKKHIKLSDPLGGRPLAPIYGATTFEFTGSFDNWDDIIQLVCAEDIPLVQHKIIEITTEKKNTNRDKIIDNDGIFDDENSYEDDDDEDENVASSSSVPEATNKIENGKNEIKDEELIVQEIDMVQRFENKILGSNMQNDDDDDEDDKYLRVLFYDNSKVQRSRVVWPILITIFSVVLVMLIIARVVALLMKRRGERYRQALLDSKNSIIYQKLSEEVAPQKLPKVHGGYKPIQQI